MTLRSILTAAAIGGLACGSASAETFYLLGVANGGTFLVNPADLTDSWEGRKRITTHFVLGNHLVDVTTSEIDCAAKSITQESRRYVRTDFSLVRETSFDPASQTPDPRSFGGLAIALACGGAAPPAPIKTLTADSFPALLRASADSLLKRQDLKGSRLSSDKPAVGVCILSKMPKDVAESALANVLAGRPPGEDPEFRKQASKIGAACTGRPEQAADGLIVGSATSLYTRIGIVGRLSKSSKLHENHLVAAWNTATEETRAPLLALTAMLGDSSATVKDVETAGSNSGVSAAISQLMQTPELAAALKTVKDHDETQKRLLVSEYFVALAMGEQSEAALAVQRAQAKPAL